MGQIIESSFLIIASVIGLGGLFYVAFRGKPAAPENCKHRRWSQWEIQQLKPIHLYSEVDEGRDLPDRVDVFMIRACVRCGWTQAKTVRGIDSQHFK